MHYLHYQLFNWVTFFELCNSLFDFLFSTRLCSKNFNQTLIFLFHQTLIEKWKPDFN